MGTPGYPDDNPVVVVIGQQPLVHLHIDGVDFVEQWNCSRQVLSRKPRRTSK